MWAAVSVAVVRGCGGAARGRGELASLGEDCALSMSVCVASSLSWLMIDLHRSAAPSSSTNFVQSLGASAARTAITAETAMKKFKFS